MTIFDQLGRFLEVGAATLGDARATLQDARRTLAALQPTVEALPTLVEEIRTLVAHANRILADRQPTDSPAADGAGHDASGSGGDA